MPFGSVTLRPGIDTESTPTSSQAAINQSNMVRWKVGLAEKIGGWDRYYPFALTGIPRTLHPWQDLNSNLRLAVGTTTSLNVIANDVNGVITPQTTTTDVLPDFSVTTTNPTTFTIIDNSAPSPTTDNYVFLNTPVSVGGIVLSGIYGISSVVSSTSYTILSTVAATTAVSHGGVLPLYTTASSSPTVTVALAGHTYLVGSSYYAPKSTTVGGIAISGSYLVQSVSGTASFTITASSIASATATGYLNGGLVDSTYYVAIGPQVASAGYGVGTYGGGTYGLGVAAPAGAGTPITATDWSLGNWGEILLANPQGGGIYEWGPESGFQTGRLIPTAPISCRYMFVTMPQQILIALGASFTGAPAPLDVAWSDSSDYTDWTPTSTTFAGSYTIPRGSMIVGGLQAPTQNLIWTDLGVWSMQYVNLPLVFGFSEIMSGCGLIGSHAAVLAEGTIFWMSQNQFFQMPGGGGPSPLACSVWDVIFQNLNTSFVANIRAGANSAFNEIWWHYPSVASTSGENDSYVKYNLVEGEWDYGQLPSGRSAWIDQSILGSPIGADPTGLIFQHEQGYNGDGAALNPFLTTGYWVIGDGENFAVVDQVLPDFIYGTSSGTKGASPLITLYTVDYPNGPVTTYGPYTANSATNQIAVRVRGRQMAMTIDSHDSNSFWRIGRIRYRYAVDGRR